MEKLSHASLSASGGLGLFLTYRYNGLILCPHMAFSLCLHTVFPLRICLYVQISPFYTDANHIGLGPTQMTSS